MTLKDFYPKIFKGKHPRLVDIFCFMADCKNRNRHTYVISNLMAKARYNAKENMWKMKKNTQEQQVLLTPKGL